MNCLTSSVVLFGLIFAAESHLLGLHEGEKCNSTHTCTKLSECTQIGDVREARPSICSFNGKDPVICCPKPVALAALSTTGQAILKCMQYEMRSCHSGFSSFVKRETINIVVGGRRAKPREHPHMALIGYGKDDDKQWLCGGSLISENYVVSAAHCTKGVPSVGPAKWVKLGDLDLSTLDEEARPEDFKIVQTIDHPEYKPPAMYNDIALYKLERTVTFNNWIKPICLHTETMIPSKEGIATGWGRTDYVGPTSDHLLEVDLSFIEEEQCKKLIGPNPGRKLPRGVDEEKIVCAGELKGGKDTCTGDSGGPLIIRRPGGCLKELIGVTSMGKQCALPNSPGLYTRISHFIPWIESIVWSS